MKKQEIYEITIIFTIANIAGSIFIIINTPAIKDKISSITDEKIDENVFTTVDNL